MRKARCSLLLIFSAFWAASSLFASVLAAAPIPWESPAPNNEVAYSTYWYMSLGYGASGYSIEIAEVSKNNIYFSATISYKIIDNFYIDEGIYSSYYNIKSSILDSKIGIIISRNSFSTYSYELEYIVTPYVGAIIGSWHSIDTISGTTYDSFFGGGLIGIQNILKYQQLVLTGSVGVGEIAILLENYGADNVLVTVPDFRVAVGYSF